MKNFSLSFVLALIALPLHADLSIIKVIANGKKVHMNLDNAKDYQMGDVVNFYQDKKLVSQGKISYLTGRKTKAVVDLFRGTPLEMTFVARARGPKVAKPDREVAANSFTAAPQFEMRPSFAEHSTQDLLYYPEKSTFLLSAAAHRTQNTFKVTGASSSKYTLTSMDASLMYSPISRFAFGLGLGFGSSSSDSGGATTSGSGLVDPSIYVTYRLMAPPENRFFWALSATISPSIGSREENNVLRGNTLIQIGTSVGMKHGAFSWILGPKLAYFSETKETSSGTESYYVISLDGEAQYDFNQNWALYAPILLSLTSDEKAVDNTFVIKAFTTFGLGVGAKYALLENLNLFTNLLYSTAPGVKIETLAPTTLDVAKSSFEINLGANYKF